MVLRYTFSEESNLTFQLLSMDRITRDWSRFRKGSCFAISLLGPLLRITLNASSSSSSSVSSFPNTRYSREVPKAVAILTPVSEIGSAFLCFAEDSVPSEMPISRARSVCFIRRTSSRRSILVQKSFPSSVLRMSP